MKYNALATDLKTCFDLRHAIHYMALGDIRARYHRSILGPFWIVIGLAIGSVGLGYLWSTIWGVSPENLVPQITIGLLLWYFISSAISESATCFVLQSEVVKNMSLPIFFFPFVLFYKQILVFVHSWLIIAIVVFVYLSKFSIIQLLFLPGLFLVVVNLFLLTTITSILAARYRDLAQIINTAMPILFFMSPILFKIEQVEELQWIIWLNPITYFVTIVRDPILGNVPEPSCYVINFVACLFLCLSLAVLYQRKSRRLVGWI